MELPFSHGQSLPGQERTAGDRLHMRPLFPAAAFSTNSLSAEYDVKQPMFELNPVLYIDFISLLSVSVTKAVLMVVFISLDDAKSCQNVETCKGM